MKDVLLGETGEGGNRSSWSTVSQEVFLLQREKCFTFVLLYHNNNNKKAAFCHNAFPQIPSRPPPSHVLREMLLFPVFIEAIQSVSLLSAYVTMI